MVIVAFQLRLNLTSYFHAFHFVEAFIAAIKVPNGTLLGNPRRMPAQSQVGLLQNQTKKSNDRLFRKICDRLNTTKTKRNHNFCVSQKFDSHSRCQRVLEAYLAPRPRRHVFATTIIIASFVNSDRDVAQSDNFGSVSMKTRSWSLTIETRNHLMAMMVHFVDLNLFLKICDFICKHRQLLTPLVVFFPKVSLIEPKSDSARKQF